MMLTNYDLLVENETIRLFIVVLIEPSSIQYNPPLFYSIFGFEILNLVVSFLSFWFVVYIIPKFQLYHLNIIRLIQLYFGSYYVTIISRALTMSFQLGIIHKIVWTRDKGGLGSLPTDWFLLLVCVIRIMFTAQYASLIPAMLGERACATLFLRDYETRQRTYISYSIYGLSTVFTIAVAWVVTSGNLGTSFCVAIFLIVSLGVIAFISFYRYNKKTLRVLSSTFHSTSSYYSLSIRYQVTENLKVMKQILIMSGIIFFFISIAIIMTVFCFVIYDFFSYEGQAIAAFLEMWVAFSANVITFFLFLLNKNWSNSTLRSLFTTSERVHDMKVVEKPLQTDLYFAQFTKQW